MKPLTDPRLWFRSWRNALPIALLPLAMAVAAPGATTRPALVSVRVADVPHVRQKPEFSGEACAEMFLRKAGGNWTQDDVFNAAGIDPALGRGCRPAELAAALRHAGVETGSFSHRVDPGRPADIACQFEAMHADLARGVPSIVCVRISDVSDADGRFRLVTGYDGASDDVLYHDPAEERGAWRTMKRAAFCDLWPLRSGEGQTWTVVRMPLEARRIASPPPRDAAFMPADYARHVMSLRRDGLPRTFAVVVQPPFVVVGDEPPDTVRRRATQTVKWAVDRLKKDFFSKDPDDILTIWLFRDRDSYDRYTREIFRETPSTPFGYYSHARKALIMNIATGGGTLVHEIVHPFIHANFPACPPWLNEGLGSLYEQCGDHNGHIRGYTNWRLAGLQRAIRAGKAPSFAELTDMDARRFYGADSGVNYAVARYLCYYLQEKGLLVRFYHEFFAAQRSDPTGYRTIQKVLGESDMDEFRRKWEKFVLELKYP